VTELEPVEARVLASLIEKQLTTPSQYPLTLNALTLACNQASNRDPVTTYRDAEVVVALESLKAKGLVRFVLPSHGRTVVRYRQALGERLALDDRQLALVAVLVLRGAQTAGELRARTERMAEYDSLAAVESDLAGLASWVEPLVARLPRRPGQKEERWVAPWCATAAPEHLPGVLAGDTPAGDRAHRAGAGPAGDRGDRLDLVDLRAQLADLATRMSDLAARVDRLERELGV
jgi:uncharacterized protein YceH (UPF0502 family)